MSRFSLRNPYLIIVACMIVIVVGLTSLVPHAIMVHESVPAKTLQEFIALSKTQQVTTGTAGAGSATHLTLERFNVQAGGKFTMLNSGNNVGYLGRLGIFGMLGYSHTF